jgi:hypothetical protein
MTQISVKSSSTRSYIETTVYSSEVRQVEKLLLVEKLLSGACFRCLEGSEVDAILRRANLGYELLHTNVHLLRLSSPKHV